MVTPSAAETVAEPPHKRPAHDDGLVDDETTIGLPVSDDTDSVERQLDYARTSLDYALSI